MWQTTHLRKIWQLQYHSPNAHPTVCTTDIPMQNFRHSLWKGFFGTEMNGKPHFVKHTCRVTSQKFREVNSGQKESFLLSLLLLYNLKSRAPLLGLARSIINYYIKMCVDMASVTTTCEVRCNCLKRCVLYWTGLVFRLHQKIPEQKAFFTFLTFCPSKFQGILRSYNGYCS